MRTASPEFMAAANAVFDGKPMRRALIGMGVSPSRAGAAAAAISRARNGAPLSLDAENELRGYLGLALLSDEDGTPCPDCGKRHQASRCYGKEIIDVVTLSPGQQVIGEPPAGHLLAVHQGAVEAVLCRAEIKQCACGVWFVQRSWNQRRCRPGCPGAHAIGH